MHVWHIHSLCTESSTLITAGELAVRYIHVHVHQMCSMLPPYTCIQCVHVYNSWLTCYIGNKSDITINLWRHSINRYNSVYESNGHDTFSFNIRVQSAIVMEWERAFCIEQIKTTINYYNHSLNIWPGHQVIIIMSSSQSHTYMYKSLSCLINTNPCH